MNPLTFARLLNRLCRQSAWFALGLLAAGLTGPIAAGAGVPALAASQVSLELAVVRPDLGLRVRCDDSVYVVVNHDWLQDSFVPYFRRFLSHLHTAVRGDGYDCDNYTMLFRAKMVLSNLLAGGAGAGEVPCGRLIVAQREDFGGVPAARGAVHALVVVRTDRGWFVVEPQTGALTALAQYPNLPGALEVTF